MFVSSPVPHLVGGTEGHDQEPHQGVGHGQGGDQVVGGAVKTPLLQHNNTSTQTIKWQKNQLFFSNCHLPGQWKKYFSILWGVLLPSNQRYYIVHLILYNNRTLNLAQPISEFIWHLLRKMYIFLVFASNVLQTEQDVFLLFQAFIFAFLVRFQICLNVI